MPQHVVLSNGYHLDIPDGTPPEEVKSRAAAMESLINPQWRGFGNLANTRETLANIGSYITNPAERIATSALNLNPVIGGADLGVGALNAIKSIARAHGAPNLPETDIPSVTDLVGGAVGTPQMDPNVSPLQRYGEAALTGILNPGKALSTGARMLLSTGGGDLGSSLASYYGGPEFAKLGQWLGSVTGASPDTAFTNIAKWFAGRQAPEVGQAGTQLQAQPTFGSVAGTGGRLMEKALGAMPLVNLPVNAARQRMEDAIQNARNAAATDINQGPLPAQIDPNSIGGNLISLARTRSASIKADASQRYQDLYNAVPRDTLVDSGPVEQAILTQANSPDISGAQRQALLARLDYMKTMRIGQPDYNGPPAPPTSLGAPTNPNLMTMGQLAAFKTELGQDIQGMASTDQRVSGPVYNAIDDVMQQNFNQLGYGPQYQAARDNYARVIGDGTVTAALDAVGGKPVLGKPGVYSDAMTEQQAHDFLMRNTQSPSAIEPFVDPNNPYWRATAAQFVSRLGNAPQGDFRGDTFARGMEKISPEVLAQLTQSQGGGPLQPTMANLRAAQVLGQNSSVAPQRHGLTNAIGSLAAVEALSHALGEHLSNLGLPAITATGVVGGLAQGMESAPVVNAMSGTGSSTPLVDALYTNFPIAATSLAQQPEQPQPDPNAPRPPSPLDQLNQQ